MRQQEKASTKNKEQPEIEAHENSTTVINKDQAQKPKEGPPAVGLLHMFRFSTKADYVLMFFGTIGSIIIGAALPSFSLLYGNIINSFSQDSQSMVDAALQAFLLFIYIGIGVFFAAWVMFACWMITGERQAIACRKQYLRCLLKQEIGWFDTTNQSQLASQFATDTFAYQEAIGEKVATFIMTIAMLITGFVIAFIKGWLLAVVILAIIPAIGISGVVYFMTLQKKDQIQKESYAEAGGRVQQALSAIKTVKQLNGEQFEMKTYKKCLQNASIGTLKFAIISGIGVGLLMFSMFIAYSLGFWWGSVLVERRQPNFSSATGYYNAGDVLVVFFSILMSGFNMTKLTPALEKLALGKQAAARIYELVDRQPLVKNPQNGFKPEKVEGIIRFQNVTFAYPKDKSRIILSNLNLEFDIKSNALVGQSGCGKSTVIQLIMRFYDPDEGKVTLDGVDLREFDIYWLRSLIGYVGQEPVLFATSIRENLLFGKENATTEQMNAALKKAEAYDFIQTLEEKLETYVGYGGGQLSGGQKQRIAIARAILKNPPILLLDEATSALDRRNERLIQKTLENISVGKTSITIAHRVKTIMNSDLIYVIDRGQVLQKGQFGQLKRYKGLQNDEEEDEKKEEVQDSQPQKFELITKKKSSTLKKGTMVEENGILLTKEEKAKKEQEEITKIYKDTIFRRLFRYVTDKIPLFIIGFIINIGNGTLFPIFSIFLANMLTTLFVLEISPSEQARRDADWYAIVFVIIACAAFVGKCASVIIYIFIGQSMTEKIRCHTYKKMLNMPVNWFDIPRNNAGTLSARLSTDCQIVNGLITTYFSIIIESVSSLVTGVIISFIFQWRTALVAIALLPLMIAAGAIKMAMQTGFSAKADAAYKDSSNLIMETLVNIRTVSSFGYEEIIEKKYSEKLQDPASLSVRRGNISGILFGVSQFAMFFVFGLIFYLGTVFIRDNPGIDASKVFTAIFAIMFAAMTVGNASHFLPDLAEGKNSAANLFLIQDSEDQYQKQIREGSKLLTEGCTGDIQFDKITFQYESRNQQLFKDFSLKIKHGQKVAFVGTSGCGKSTIMQLILRYYDPEQGNIFINGTNIKDFQIHYLRSRFGVVSQEPVLFNGSFRDNIIYNKENVSEEQLINAAKEAKALEFIEGRENLQSNDTNQNFEKEKAGFDREVGVKGSHISGGQKQRVAIARAVIRNPSVLLLDEATSALDGVNEKKVQESLDQIMKNKTTISIAHRLETIYNSDQIYVFEKGKIAEQGNYQTLMNMKGYFFNLERGTQFI